VGLYEDKYYQVTRKSINDLNTEEQIKRGMFYLDRYNALKSEMEELKTEHEELEKMYSADIEEVEGSPNACIPLIAPIVDGHISSMTEQNIVSNVKGKRISDHEFSRDAQLAIDLTLKENDIRQRLKDGIKRYILFGWCVCAIDYDEGAFDGIGLSTLRFPPIHSVFVDGNIKNMMDYQDAQYIIEEVGFQSLMWARKEYGDDIADVIQINNSDNYDNADVSLDEQFSFMYLKVWHRNNKKGNLQLLEMDGTGFVMRESDPDKPYYKYTENKYPYEFCGLYQKEGEFARFGEGKRLKYLEKLLNNLYNEIILSVQYSSQGKKYIDPVAGGCDPDEVANPDPRIPVICSNPRENVYIAQGTGINAVVVNLVQMIVSEAQRISRFSALMTGNDTGGKITATQAGIQTQQGNTNISDKKADTSNMLGKSAKQSLEIEMEKWQTGVDIYEDEKKEKKKWLDIRRLSKIPVLVPADENYIERHMKNNPDMERPEFMQFLASEDIEKDGEVIKKGTPISKKANFDIDISIGEGLPTNKIALYNIVLSLAQLQVIDENTGQPKPLLGYNQVKKMIEDLVGLPIDDSLEEAKQGLNQYGIPQPNIKPINVNANVPGANMSGAMSGASMGGGGIPA